MPEPLHPSSLSEILDRTAQIYRARFLAFLGIAVLPTGVLLAFAAVVALLVWRLGSMNSASSAIAGVVAALLLGLIFLVALPALLAATSLATAAMSHAAARIFMGQPVSIRDSYLAVWRRGWSYIGLFVFQIVVVWVVPFGAWFVLSIVGATLAPFIASGAGGVLMVLAAVLAVAGLLTYGFWMATRVSLAFPACVVEQIGAWDALKRSATLTAGSKGRILLLYVLGTVLNWILSMAIIFPLIIVLALLPSLNSPAQAQTQAILIFVVYGASFAVQALTRPIYGIALILFYYDQRIRQEAFDIEWMMLRAGLVVPPQPQDGTQPETPAVPVEANLAPEEAAIIASGEEPAAPAPDPAPESALPDNPEPNSASTEQAHGEPT